MVKLTPQEIFDRLVKTDKILAREGRIRFDFDEVNIIVRQRDVVGNIMQEWMEGWMTKNGIAFSSNPNTQMPPDFFLDPDDKTKNLLEIKAFNYDATPGFDIADFKSFQREIVEKPYMLHAKYLIFGYKMSEEGLVTVKKVWLQNVWEICRPSENWAINVQFKNGMVHKIRPAKWYSTTKSTRFRPFERLEHFLSAMEQTIYDNPDTKEFYVGWRKRMTASYQKFYDRPLAIPKWEEELQEYYQTAGNGGNPRT